MAVALVLAAVILHAVPPRKSGGTAAYVAFGGSNTCGHGVTKDANFRTLVQRALGPSVRQVNRCVPATGPLFAAACFSGFLTADARFATVEYLPNMGDGGTKLQLGAYASLLRSLVATPDLRIVAVHVFEGARNESGRHQYAYPLPEMNRTHGVMLQLARELDVPVVVVNARTAPEGTFESHGRHLAAPGHALVARAVMEHFRAPSSPASPPRNLPPRKAGTWPPAGTRSSPQPVAPRTDQPGGVPAVSSPPVTCYMGSELQDVLTAADGFKRVDLLSPEASRLGAGTATKVGWEATEPGSRARVCIARGRGPLASPVQASLGMLKSHDAARPLMGLANVSCVGGCQCSTVFRGMNQRPECAKHNCSFDGLHKNTRTRSTITDFYVAKASPPPRRVGGAEVSGREASDGCACELEVSNGDGHEPPPANRHRLVLRALVVGPPGRMTLFANGFHFNTNPGLETQNRRGRRRRSRCRRRSM